MKINSFIGRKCRSNLEITFNIIEACKNPIILSHLMYKTNTNITALKPYIKLLVEHGMLRIVSYNPEHGPGCRKTRFRYQRTKKGLKFLRAWNTLVNIWKKEFSGDSEMSERKDVNI